MPLRQKGRSLPTVVRISTSYVTPAGYDALFAAYDAALAAIRDDGIVLFEFDGCTFLNQHAVAFLGGLVRHLQHQGCTVKFKLSSLETPVRNNLRKNGFLRSLGFDDRAGGNNTIPFRSDAMQNEYGFLRYLSDEWLGRGWVDVSDALKDAICSAVLEVYANAFEHGHSAVGVFSCGQFYPIKQEIALAFVDFGIGIPRSVSVVPEAAALTDSGRIAWALERGNTSKKGNRGVGLDILRSFVQVNNGRMDIVSHTGHVRLTRAGLTAPSRNRHFPGTVINITLKADEKRYAFKSEIAAQSIF
jgi:hypothetical protein